MARPEFATELKPGTHEVRYGNRAMFITIVEPVLHRPTVCRPAGCRCNICGGTIADGDDACVNGHIAGQISQN